MHEFTKWCAKVRAEIVARIGEGGDAICGADEDLRGYYDTGYAPETAAYELVSYYAEMAA